MWRTVSVISLLLSSLVLRGQSTARIHKCCPRSGYELAVDLFGDADSHSIFECMSIVNASLIATHFGGQFYGLKVNDSDSLSHLPVCPAKARQSLYPLRNGLTVNLPLASSCVDLINGSYQVVMCSEELLSHPIPSSLEVYTLRKCCPVNFVYNEERRSCQPIGNNFQGVTLSPFWPNESRDVQLLKSLLNQFKSSENHIGEPLFHVGPAICSSNEVLVNYQLKTHEFTLLHNRIIPKSKFGQRNLNVFTSQPRDPFCIDSVAPSAVHPPEDASIVANITWLVRVCRPKSICDSIPCIRKCCNNNEKVVKRNNQTICESFEQDLELTFHDLEGELFPNNPTAVNRAEYGLLFYQSCPRYILDESLSADRHYFNEKNGFLHFLDADPLSHHEYCTDYVQMGEEVRQKTFVCFREDASSTGFYIYAVGLCISCVFLTATLIVYACLPKLLNLHGKTLVSHVSSLLVAYAGLAYIQFGITVQPKFCYAVALFTYGSFLAAFSWLNVMCFDIWWTFGTVRQSRGLRKTRDTKRFIGYSVYAWGIPLFLTTFLHLVDKFSLLHSDYLPNMGNRSCWFADQNGLSNRLFFLLPMGIIISMNACLFILTAVHCNRVKSEIHRMQSNDCKDSHKKRFFADKARMLMNLKLFSVMGISWVLELITSFYKEPKELWYVTDFVNVMQGVFVFLIFVFKRNVLTAVNKRLGIVTKSTRGGVTTLGVTTTTGTTCTSLSGSNNQINCALIPPSSKSK